MADENGVKEPEIDIAPEQKTGPVTLHMTYKGHVLDLPNVDYVIGIAQVGDSNYHLESGLIPMDKFMGLIVDMVDLVNGMMAKLPEQQQKQVAAVIADRTAKKAMLQRISGRLNRGVVVPMKKIVKPGEEN